MTQVTPTGFSLTTAAEYYNQLVAALQGIFGADIDVGPGSVNGQTLALFSNAEGGIAQQLQYTYQSLNPKSATGAALSTIVQLNGLTRKIGVPSTVTLQLTGTLGAKVPAGTLVGSSIDSSIFFVTTADGTFPVSGNVNVPAVCTTPGAVSAVAGSLTEIANPIFGWASVTNPADASVGTDTETDAQLRLRQAVSTSGPAQSVVDSIQAGLLAVPGVVQAFVYENPTGSTVGSLPAHSINAVVDGGDDIAVATAIYLRRSAGVTMVGATSVTIVDSQGFSQVIHFDRQTNVPIYIIINLTPLTGYPSDGDTIIQNNILAYGSTFQIGQTVVWSALMQACYGTASATFTASSTLPIDPTSFSIKSLYLGIAPSPSLSNDIAIDNGSLATFSQVNIMINHV